MCTKQIINNAELTAQKKNPMIFLINNAFNCLNLWLTYLKSCIFIRFALKFRIMSNEILGVGSRVKHPQFGKGVVVQVKTDAYEIGFIEHGVRLIMRSFEGLEVIDLVETPSDLATYEKIEKSLIKILRKFSDASEITQMGQRWNGGKMILVPGDNETKEKEVPLETFFHKIVMLRDRLRVLEAKLNASNLSDEDKVEMQQYITRCYGSLTTFNVLFKNKEDLFIGEKSN